MFEGFDAQADGTARRRWAASAGTSLAIYVVIGGVIALIAGHTVHQARNEPEVDVTFRAPPEPELAKATPPPPPPPALRAATRRPGKKAPSTPTAIPEQRPSEADPVEAITTDTGPSEFGDGLAGVSVPPPPLPPPPTPSLRLPDPVDEPEEMTPARGRTGNLAPAYPEDARKKGLEGQVILELSIDQHGEVTAAKVLRGDEPFVTAALSAVQRWHYRPAVVAGEPTATRRIVKIPFRIRA